MSVTTIAKSALGIFSGQSPQSAGYTMLARVSPGMGSPPAMGDLELLHAYSRQPWLRAIPSKIAFSTASVSWNLYAVTDRSGRAVRSPLIQRSHDPDERRFLLREAAAAGALVQIVDHPFLRLIHQPNSYMGGHALRKLTQIYLDLVGNAFWLKERVNGEVTGFWPLPPHWVKETPIPGRQSYRVAFRTWQGYIPETEILWMADLDPENPYGRGRGVGQAIVDELEIDYWGGRYLKGYFWNGARPELLITAEELNPGDTKRLEEDWASKNQGFWNAFKPYFLNRKVDVVKLDANFRNMQLVQLRKAERDTIIQVWGVPPELLGVIENSNRATIMMAREMYTEETVVPRLEFLRDCWQQRLIPEWDERIIVDYVSPTQHDKEFNLQVMRANPGAFTIDEWRDTGGRGPLVDGQGNTFLMPNLVTPMDPAQLPTDTPSTAPTVPADQLE